MNTLQELRFRPIQKKPEQKFILEAFNSYTGETWWCGIFDDFITAREAECAFQDAGYLTILTEKRR